jgi:chitodextrinase
MATAISLSQVNLAWVASTDNIGVAGYKVYRGTSLIATVTTTNHSDMGLSPSTTYSYSVSAVDAAGNISAQSAAVSATTGSSPVSPDAPIAVSSPKVGETVPTGSEYVITWTAPSDAASFSLFYSLDKGTTWQVIAQGVSGNSYAWKVPALRRNKKNCLVKVIGYDASNKKIGADVSDGTSLEVTKLTSLNGGETLKGTQSAAITWVTRSTESPVASVKLKYTLNSGKKWKLIDEVTGNPGSYTWQLPTVKKAKDKCRVAVILQDDKGKTVGKVSSDAYFTIQP